LFAGFGIGLRPNFYQEVLDTNPAVDWFEIITEDFLIEGGPALYYLERIRQNYPIAMHGVSMSIGSCDELDYGYLKRLKALVDRFEPLSVSDHFCWTGINGVNLHDLMPLPYTQECINHLVGRIQRVQEFLDRPILLENVSSYVSYNSSQMTEWEFISHVAKQSGCNILLDINNIFINSVNHNFNPETYLFNIPKAHVQQFHLAGHDNCVTHIIDTHDDEITQTVWDLYEKAVKHYGDVATLIERDANIPPLNELIDEVRKAKCIHGRVNSGLFA
jgi:uncharacterized protein (UPF0276 family)